MLAGCTLWPSPFAARYRDEGYWSGQTLGSLPAEWAAVFGQRTAVAADGQRWCYRELAARSSRLAASFRVLGIKRYDRVVVQLPNVAEFFEILFALFELGAIPVIVLPAYRRTVRFSADHRRLTQLLSEPADRSLPVTDLSGHADPFADALGWMENDLRVVTDLEKPARCSVMRCSFLAAIHLCGTTVPITSLWQDTASLWWPPGSPAPRRVSGRCVRSWTTMRPIGIRPRSETTGSSGALDSSIARKL